MTILNENLMKLDLERCPHCKVHRPHLVRRWFERTEHHGGQLSRFWAAFVCQSCGGVVLCGAPVLREHRFEINEIYPSVDQPDEAIPERARHYLSQAIDSVHAPSGAIVLAASAVDAMLKAKNYKQGSLYDRIDKAAEDHLITAEMATWAHEVRLDANDERHADEDAPLPTTKEAHKAIRFTSAFAEYLFVLPTKVERGRKGEDPPTEAGQGN
jgi:hypothetical protein